MRGPWCCWIDFAVATDRDRGYRRRIAAQAISGVPGGETPEQTCSHRTAALDGIYRTCAVAAIGELPRGPPLASLAVFLATQHASAVILPTAQEKSGTGASLSRPDSPLSAHRSKDSQTMSGEAYAHAMYSVKPNLPDDFPRPASFWAAYFGVTVETVRRWPQEHGIPYHFLGREKFIRPSHLMERLPTVVPGIQDEPD